MYTKKCCRCRDTKNISAFSKNNYNLDKLQNWCKDCCKEEYAKSCSKYVYIIKRFNEILYVGSCANLGMRMSSHIRGHVPSTRDYMISGEWTNIMYLDVSSYVEDRLEREFLEYALIDLLTPALNRATREISLEDKSKEVELLELAQDLIDMNQFKTYKEIKNERNECMYFIDENNVDEYVEDISNFINEYVDNEEDEEQ